MYRYIPNLDLNFKKQEIDTKIAIVSNLRISIEDPTSK